ncbi:hypothetical protein [Pseudobacteriovorax antillogorgiicola]|uniref:Uncharacterized protein n=1 Tax=Pseudobacteriovorax antillogorgiicola TaxID=1513793 RepID=A0A1Y6BB12_9BACT|nr:hypothetical protein [Pseudobacteriovorax antillogorgiicola]TCS58845.1 hypothetical protein EDD56_102360 [Pseudobacteriovorax antillogorgiicola]SME94068.1 hypothetical protein SAMN06296036_10283 [Pseudobacteriovorax antillogorgiicola]
MHKNLSNLTKTIIIMLAQLLVFFQSYSLFSQANIDLGGLGLSSLISNPESSVLILLNISLLLSATGGLFLKKSWLYGVNAALSVLLLLSNSIELGSVLLSYQFASSSILLMVSSSLVYWLAKPNNFEDGWVSTQKNYVLFLAVLFTFQGVELLMQTFMTFAGGFELELGSLMSLGSMDDLLIFGLVGSISIITGFYTLLNGKSVAKRYLALWLIIHMTASFSLVSVELLGILCLILPAAILAVESVRYIVQPRLENRRLNNILLDSSSSVRAVLD